MHATFSLNQMSKAEKIGAMELLWDDLCREEKGVESPAWHGELLRRREGGVEAGTEGISDWQDAKQKIRASVS